LPCVCCLLNITEEVVDKFRRYFQYFSHQTVMNVWRNWFKGHLQNKTEGKHYNISIMVGLSLGIQ